MVVYHLALFPWNLALATLGWDSGNRPPPLHYRDRAIAAGIAAGMVSSPPSFAGQPERSRNAKAQARHRAKRKAYIEHLEHSVSRLSSIAGVDGPSDQPLDRVRQLERT
jgi:hypothetical protein